MKRKWLKVLLLAMMAGASFGSPMNPKEIEDLMYVMNQTMPKKIAQHQQPQRAGLRFAAEIDCLALPLCSAE